MESGDTGARSLGQLVIGRRVIIMYADEPLLDCHENTSVKLGHADLHRSLTIGCTGRVYPPADVIIWTWRDVILASNDVINDVIDDVSDGYK